MPLYTNPRPAGKAYVADPGEEAAYEKTGDDVTGGRFFRDWVEQGGDGAGEFDERYSEIHDVEYVEGARKARTWDERDEERRSREYVKDGENPEGLEPSEDALYL